MNKTPERNDPCPCSSGKKYKKCCGRPGLAKHDITYVASKSSLFDSINKVSGVAHTTARSLKERIAPLTSLFNHDDSSQGPSSEEPKDSSEKTPPKE